MDTTLLKKFAQAARRQLLEQVAARLELVLQSDSVEIREKEKTVNQLREQIKQSSQEAVVDRVAYTWFNRFCALRFMDVNHYTRLGIVSPAEGFTQPEILQEAKNGVIDTSLKKVDKQRVVGLLNGQLPASNPQQESYRLLLVAACNAYHKEMPFLFPEIEDYTELLMPDDLLSENSVLQGMRETLTEDACRDVEVIGWLYQFYISERKDEVFAGLKKNKKIEAEDIPAATQLFTPHWIVRYLVENSLGRLWLLNHPESRLVDQMEYYIAPEEPETDFLAISSPEEIKVCDPACGSGHMLTYAFDLLYAIYEEEGYDPVEIPGAILKHNLYGIEIDERAGHLSAFALMMKARGKDRRFFNRNIEPSICVLENITFSDSEIDVYKKAVGRDIFTEELWFLLKQFREAANFGSLIQPRVRYPRQVMERLEEMGIFSDLFLRETNRKVKKALRFSDYLSPQYHVVVANPPYMGGKGLNVGLKEFLRDQYTDVKSDTFSAFIIRNLALAKDRGQLGFMSPFVWMFISSYQKLRTFLIDNKTITSLIQLEYSGFEGATVPVCAFTLDNFHKPQFKGGYVRLSDFRGAANQAPKTLEAIQNPDCGWFFRAFATDFKRIPGSPIAYWVSDRVRELFDEGTPLNNIVDVKTGMQTGDNNSFLRLWSEVSNNAITKISNLDNQKRWYLYSKGGDFRRWYGNVEHIVDWKNNGHEIRNMVVKGSLRSRVREINNYFRKAASWSFVSSAYFGCRYKEPGIFFDVAGSCALEESVDIETVLGFLCSKISSLLLNTLNPTLNFQIQDISNLPFLDLTINPEHIRKLIMHSKQDWNSFETAWGFSAFPLLDKKNHKETLPNIYQALRSFWQATTKEMKALEEENNRTFIDTYGLQAELDAEIPLEEITLTRNPYFRYRGDKAEEELEALLLADTMKEFISYSVGCMMGRYSLDKEGLILANAGDTLAVYLQQVPEPSYPPDEDNVIPLLEGEWFEDDIAERFKDFLKITFGENQFEENLMFLEEALGRDIRSYFVKDFYKEHVKMYKKRPIYWMFSSPNGSFNALIYMHRYRPDTISVILNDYLRQYSEKLSAYKTRQESLSISESASQGAKTKAIKEIDKINKELADLKEYENEILYPLATEQIEIDLDDGVKANYNKFGKALKHVPGLSR